MVDLDLPAVEIDLQQLLDRAGQVAGEQIGRLAIVQLFAATLAVRTGRNHDQAQGTGSGATLPVHLRDLFVTNLAAPAAVEDVGSLPFVTVVLAHVLGGKLVHAVKPARTVGGTKTQLGILACAHQQHRSFRNVPKASAIAKTAIAG